MGELPYEGCSHAVTRADVGELPYEGCLLAVTRADVSISTNFYVHRIVIRFGDANRDLYR